MCEHLIVLTFARPTLVPEVHATVAVGIDRASPYPAARAAVGQFFRHDRVGYDALGYCCVFAHIVIEHPAVLAGVVNYAIYPC